MPATLTRRQILHSAALGVIGGLLAACSGNTPQPAPTATTAPSVAPTSAASTVAPAATVAPPSAQPTAPAAATVASAPVAAPTSTVAVATTATSAPTAGIAPTATPPQPALAAALIGATTRFLDSLSATARDKATYAFDDAERVRWHWTTPSGFPRNGLSLKELGEPQRNLALALLRESVSDTGYQKLLDIMSLQRDLGNDPLLYYVTVFGTPGAADPWGWRFEGHHISRHFTIVGDKVGMTPFFHGSWPTINDAKLRAMPREEDAARELVRSLAGQARDRAIFQQSTLTQHVTWNEPAVGPLDPVGIPYGELAAPGQGLIMEIIATYLGTLHPTIGDPLLARVRVAGLEQLRFGWAGSVEPKRPHYYRIQGPTFLLEFDNSRNGGTHIHSVWRDFGGDFGRDLG